MPQIINTNVASLNSQRNLNTSQSALAQALQRLSSGLRINSAKDDAAGLGISERFTTQIRGLDQAARNANDGVSLAQTGEAALSSAGDLLQRIRELAVQSANASNSAGDRQALNSEVGQLTSELNRIATSANFNGQKLFDGSFTSAVFQVGANANQTITATTTNLTTTVYGNHRIGAVVSSAATPDGDLNVGSTAGALASSAAAVSRVAGGTFALNGSLGSATITYAAGSSAKSTAALVNAQTTTTGVSATALTRLDLTVFVASASYSLDILSNNTVDKTISFTVGAVVNADGLSAAVNAFNDVSATTGVVAKLNTAGTGITISNETGENITLENNSVAGSTLTVGAFALAVGGADAVATGQLTLDSDKSFNVTGAVVTDFFGAATAASQLQRVSDLDVSTVGASNRSIALVDSAIATISGQRAKFGALQARFESAIVNLQATSENLSAARSRIRDADFAQETAALTRAQILQQAGVAILAQANAIPNNVLALLRG